MAPEVAAGVFERTLTLLKGVAAEAEYVNGTLKITAPVAVAALQPQDQSENEAPQ